MLFGMICALGAAVCFGTATVLQAMAARAAAPSGSGSGRGSGVDAALLLTSALQRGSVTVATAGMVVGETVGPAVVGVVWLGDRTREGLGWLAVLGFTVAVVGALALARFGEAPVDGGT